MEALTHPGGAQVFMKISFHVAVSYSEAIYGCFVMMRVVVITAAALLFISDISGHTPTMSPPPAITPASQQAM